MTPKTESPLLKCVECIKYQFMSNTRPMMHEAVARAKEAVTVFDGEALCEAHLQAFQYWRKK